ncbi:MAG: hypothetical protein KDC44_00325 [Phaeodactylibacter sp.]|nr:hypothetical protein [Phaeodactylibacter sp.]
MKGFERHSKWLIIVAFFGAYLALGLTILPDYGISFDEPIQRDHGIVAVDYMNGLFGWYEGKVFEQHDYQSYEHRYYGVLFSSTAYGLECLLKLDDFREWHLLRHYMVFGLAWIASIFFFGLLIRCFADWRWALLGTLFLILSPRLFAHNFYNVKDAVLVSTYIIASFALIGYLETFSWRRTLGFALATAVLINVRIVGLVIPLLVGIWLIPALVYHWQEGAMRRQILLSALAYFGLSAVLTILLWPYLWEAPLAHLLEAFLAMDRYKWAGTVRLWNETYQAQQVPWFYLPSWMLITIPLVYWLLFLRGFFPLIRQTLVPFFTWKWEQTFDGRFRNAGVILSLFLVPILIVIGLGSTLYDGWRQLFFIYPPFLVIALYGLHRQLSGMTHTGARMVLALVLVLTAQVGYRMIRIHPQQQVYFNLLAGDRIEFRHETDYWGLSYKQALEALLQVDPSDSVSYYAPNYPGTANREFLPDSLRRRLDQRWQYDAGAEYYLTNFRSDEERSRFRDRIPPFNREVLIIRADGIPILGVFRMQE